MKFIIAIVAFVFVFDGALASQQVVSSIAAGGSHSLAVTSDGLVWAWGSNGNGQLGNGIITSSNIPIQVPGLTGVVSVAAGSLHSLALKSDGTVWAWGYNVYGQIGNGTLINSDIPIQTSLLTGVITIACGASHSLALKSDGTLWAWGYNWAGQLGNGSQVNSSIPVPSGIANVIAVEGGDGHTLALKRDGTLWGCGYNGNGEVGNGSFGGYQLTSTPVTNFSTPPTPVTVRVSIKRVHGAGSATPAFWTNQNVFQWLNEVNTLYATWNTKIQFQMISQVEDILDSRMPVSWYDVPSASTAIPNPIASLEDEAEKYPCKYLWRTDAVNIYLVNTISGAGGVCSFPAAFPQRDIVVLTPSMLGDSVGFAHELGHYLGLLHTHANHEPFLVGACPTNSLAGVNATFGDLVGDTRNDSSPCSFTSNLFAHDSAFDSLASSAGYTASERANVRSNLMSYHTHLTAGLPTLPQIFAGYTQAKVTSGQTYRMWQLLPYRGRALIGNSVPALTGAVPANAISPGPSLVSLTGTNLPISGGTGAPQVAVRMGEQTSYFATSSPSFTVGALAEPLAPGVHCAGLLVNNDLVAYVPQAVAVRPSLELTALPTLPDPSFTLTLTSSVPNAFVYLVIGLQFPTPIPASWSAYPYFFIDLTAPYLLVPITTDAQGIFQLSANITGPNSIGLPSGVSIAVQALEVTGLYRLTNVVELQGP